MVITRKSKNQHVLRVADGDGVGGLAGGENGKMYGKGMNAARQRLRRFGRATGARTRPVAGYSITATLSAVSDPLNVPKTFVLKYASTIGRYDYLFLEFDPRLSAGEMSYLQLFSRVYSCFGSIEFGRKVKDKEPWRFKDLPPLCDARLYQYDVLLFMDEVETTLHPRLQAESTFIFPVDA